MKLYRILLELWMGTLRRYLEASSRLFRVQAATFYVKFASDLRAFLIGVCLSVVCLMVFASGFFLVHLGLFLWLPWSLKAKAILIFCLGAFYVTVSGLAIASVLSEGRWMRLLRTDVVVRQALTTK